MIAYDGEEVIEDDIDSNELLHELYENGQDSDFTRLTEMVRKHYLNYLEKQLEENLLNCNFTNKNNGIHKEDYDNEMCKKSIKKTAELLEDKAVKACMISKFYQRAMVKIIAIVRRTTQEKRLLTHLEKCIQTKDEFKPVISSKETQTEAGLLVDDCISRNPNPTVENAHDKNKMSLDEKIEMFQKHLKKEKCIDIVKKYPLNNYTHKMSKRQHKHHHEHHNYGGHSRHRGEQHSRHKLEIDFSPASSVVTTPNSPISPVMKQTTKPLDNSIVECSAATVVENENSNDSIGAELARLFSEEKTELDEIFGIDPNEEPDDPQICKILKEIEEAKINPTKANAEIKPSTCTQSYVENPEPENCISLLEPRQQIQQPCSDLSLSTDLSKSIWPCELFMQRRKLSESLARLVDEDMRWHDVMKWKFSQLFGEDSDDEFTPCSPSIELDEVLIGSCIRRISPWVVKHLMKPMRDNLIGNRFLFKKLAKNLARSIIMENQYPAESIIKDCVENYFCLHQAVMSLEDLEVDMPSISSF